MIPIIKSNAVVLFQFLALAGFVVFGVYARSSEVPAIQSKMAEVERRTVAIESQMPFVVQALSRIEKKIDDHNARKP